MGQKLYFIFVGLFFVLMNGLLWRAEFSDQKLSAPVPMESVVRRVLETADDSTLEIRHHGQKIGYCRWAVTWLTESKVENEPSLEVPEGMVTGITGHRIDLDGTLTFQELEPLRFNYSLILSTNQHWKSMHARVSMAPLKWEILSSAADETVKVVVARESKVQEYSYRFQDLGDPLKVFRDLAGPFWSGAVDLAGLPLGRAKAGSVQAGFRWQAHTDHHPIGHSQVPVYRVEAPLVDKYKITIYLQKSGEILRVLLPDEVTLVNDKLLSM